MSVATEIARLQTAKSDIKQSIENKGVAVPTNESISNYDSYIDSIVQGEPELDVGGKNPVLIKEVEKVIPFSETDFPNITPTTSQQNFYNSETIGEVTLDLNNYDYVVKNVFKIEYEYAGELPLSSVATKRIYIENIQNIVRVSNGNYSYVGNPQGFPYNSRAVLVKSKNQTSFNSVGFNFSGSFYYGTPASTYNSRNNVLSLKTAAANVMIDNNRMTADAWELVDAENAKLIFDIKVYQVDKGTSPYGVAYQSVLNNVIG